MSNLLRACGIDSYFRDNKGKFHSFLLWNVIAALAHLANAVASFFTASEIGRNNTYPVFQDYALWQQKSDYCSNDTGAIGYTQTGMSNEFVILPTESKQTSELSLFWLIIGFHMLSFGFQISLNTNYFRDWYVEGVLERGVNPMRFLEYSISASLMVVCLALISNILSLYALLGLGIMTAATQLFGLLAECLFSDEYLAADSIVLEDYGGGPLVARATFRDSEVATRRPVKPDKPDKPTEHPLAKSLRRLGWAAHFSGWVTMLGGYIGILLNQFFFSRSQSSSDGVSAPAWVDALIIVIAVLYNVFGFIQLFQLCAKDPYLNSVTGKRSGCPCVSNGESGDGRRMKVCGMSLNEGVEFCYVLNSLATKSVLGWVIIGQISRTEDVIGTTITC